MLRLLADENFDGTTTRALLRRRPDLDLVRVQDIGLAGADDPSVLAWAAENDRILLTHDRETLPKFAFQRVKQGRTMPGVFLILGETDRARLIDDILLAEDASEPEDWSNQVCYFPL